MVPPPRWEAPLGIVDAWKHGVVVLQQPFPDATCESPEPAVEGLHLVREVELPGAQLWGRPPDAVHPLQGSVLHGL